MTARRQTMPTVVQPKDTAARKGERVVGFNPVTSICRPANYEEKAALYEFETHAQRCDQCHDPYRVHKEHRQLCKTGHKLAQDVARYLYNKPDGATYAHITGKYQIVRVELPDETYVHTRGLLDAIERSIRRRNEPFVSMDRTYYVAPRTSASIHERAREPSREREQHYPHHRRSSITIEQREAPRISTATKQQQQRRRHSEIVDWPSSAQSEPVVVEVSSSKRGSLYAADMAQQRRDSVRYNVEIREPRRAPSYHHQPRRRESVYHSTEGARVIASAYYR